MNPKILLLATTSYAGMGPYVASIVNSFEPEDNVRFFLVEGEDRYYSRNVKEDLKKLCTIVKAPRPSKLRTLYQIAIDGRNPFAKQIKALCVRECVQVVHDLTSTSDVALMKFFAKRGKLIYTVHDIAPHEGKKAFYKQWRQNVIYKRVYKAIGLSDYLYTNSISQQKQVALKYPRSVCHYSPFPSLVTEEVACGEMVPAELDGIGNYILFFGRIEAYKGLNVLIDAFIKSSIGDKVKLVIAGKGDFDYNGVTDNIIFINRYIDDLEIASLYRNATCVVYPYISATQSGVISVSSYFGTPVIVSDVDFFKESLGENYPYIFKVYDSDGLSVLLQKILSDNRETLSNEMRRLYKEKYDAEVSRNDLMKIYKDIKTSKTGIYKSGGVRTKSDLKEYITADYDAFGFRHPFLSKFTYSENGTMFAYVKNLRKLEYYMNKKQYPWDKLFKAWHMLKWRRMNLKHQLYICPNCVGKGFHLVHHGYRRIGSIRSIGENCTILPMVLIGKKTPDSDTSGAVIGDNCYIGAGAIIMNPVKIGNNVTIGAGSVVTKDIPDNCVVAGNPAQIIRRN